MPKHTQSMFNPSRPPDRTRTGGQQFPGDCTRGGIMRKPKWLTVCGTSVLAIALAGVGGSAYAQRNDRNNNQNNRDNQNQNRDQNQRQDNRNNYVQQDNNRNNNQYHRFDARDRQNFQSWYSRNRSRAPWANDRYPRGWDSRIRPGYRIGPDMWRYYRPVPYDLARTLPLPPPGYRYVMLGNRIVLVDNYDTIRDGFSFSFNF